MFNTLSDPYLVFAFWTGVAALAATMLFALQIVYLRAMLRRRERDERTFLATWRPILLSSLTSAAPAALPELASRDRLFFLKLWNHLQESLRGAATSSLNEIAYRVGCDAFSRRLLRRGNRAERLLATLTLGHLRDRAAWDMLVTQTLSADNTTSINALRALVQIDAEATAQQLTPLLLARDDWPIARLAVLLQEAKTEFAGELLDATGQAKPKELLRALRLIEALRLTLPPTVLARILDHEEDAELVSAALRVSIAPALLSHIRPHLLHQDWRVRLQAAKALGRIGEPTDIERLIPLLSDTEWWVRYRAAHALIDMPFFGRAKLASLHAKLSDRFARDMLSQVLAERGAS